MRTTLPSSVATTGAGAPPDFSGVDIHRASGRSAGGGASLAGSGRGEKKGFGALGGAVGMSCAQLSSVGLSIADTLAGEHHRIAARAAPMIFVPLFMVVSLRFAPSYHPPPRAG